MGLDMYLKSTGHNHRRVQELAVARAKEFNAFRKECIFERFVGLDSINRRLLTDKKGRDKVPRDFLARFKRVLLAKAHSLGGILRPDMTYGFLVKEDEVDPVHEIGYWRKEWPLHEFIIKNFGDPNEDNLTEVYLDEAAITKIIDHYKNYEDYSDPFRQALDIVRGGGVVFYWAWY